MMKITSLNGQWMLSQKGNAEAIPAVVPGCVHTDLLNAGKIPDPFYRDNELQQAWVGETDWIYQRTFTVTDDLLTHDAVLLRFHGLDTIATVRLNGEAIATTENMFRTYEFDVKARLKIGENRLEVEFKSPMQYVRHMDLAKGEMAGWIEPMRVNSGAWIRKEPCNFGWDWGPKMPTVGIWRDVELVAYNTARLTDVLILQEHHDNRVDLICKLTQDALVDGVINASIALTLNGQAVASQSDIVFDAQTAEVTLTIENPQLWWVNGLGEQPLYNLEVRLFSGDGQLLDGVTKRIGLRVLQLETPEDAWGRGMFFTCNGVPFFAKGANWIPASPYPAEPSRDDLEVFVKASADANMNMLRVWGGGIYEDNAFYDLCDEYGIAVWQDFLFACGTYPSYDDEWMANVRQEAIQNVRRIRHHACLALWCGNNEIEQGMMDSTWVNTVSWDDYNLLFVDLLGGVVKDYDPQRSYWQGSPHSPGNHLNPYDETVGDTHLWSVWHGKEPFEWYRSRQDRFCSEFGFQSFPEPATVYEFTAPEDRNITSYVMEHHQRSQIGNGTIIHYMLDWYQLPTSFENMVWLSQILQGMAMKYAVEHWRRNMPRTMGTLYWQLNDMWGAPSWASMDWHGRWKALHYMAKRFNHSLLISGFEDMQAGTVDIHVTSDRLTAVSGVVVYKVTDAQGVLIASDSIDATIEPNSNTHIKLIDFSELIAIHTKRNLLIWLELYVDGELVSDNLVLLSRPKHIAFIDPRLDTQIQQAGAHTYAVTVTAQAPALYVWLELPDAQFDDNFIDLQANQARTITVIAPQGMDEQQFRDSLKVASLYDTYR